MTATRPPISQFRRRLEARDHMLGTFIKFPSSHSTEIVGAVGFDFVVIDQEHSAFDRTTIDVMILGARAFNVAPLVRVADGSPSSILSVLDLGASGVLVPHIDTAEKAREIAAACRYRGGTRGFATTTRAGDFGGLTMAQHKDRQDAEVACIAMIEDPDAIDRAEEIVAVDGIHAVFIGRGDLYSAYEAESMQAPVVRKAAERVFAAARKANKPVLVLVNSPDDFATMRELGASAFLAGSDQGFVKATARKMLDMYGRNAVAAK